MKTVARCSRGRSPSTSSRAPSGITPAPSCEWRRFGGRQPAFGGAGRAHDQGVLSERQLGGARRHRLARVADLDGAVDVAQLVERRAPARGREVHDERPARGRLGRAGQQVDAPALWGAGACTRPFVATTSPPRATMAARAASSVGKRACGRPIWRCSGLTTSSASASSADSDTGSPPRSAIASGAFWLRPASPLISASAVK